MWPPVNRVCTRCRAALTTDEPCGANPPSKVCAMRTSAGRARMRELSFERVPKARWLGTTWGLIGASSAGAIYTVAALAIGLGTNGARFGHDLVMAAFVSVGGLAGVLLGGVFGVMLPLPRQFFERRAVGATEPCPVAEGVEELAGTLARSSDEQPPDAPLAELLELTARAGAVATLRVGRHEDLRIDLDDGRRVHVEKGRLDLVGAAATGRLFDEEEARALLEELGLAPEETHGETSEGPIFADSGRAWALREGARVLVRSPTRESRREQGGAFRTAANRDLVPIGVLRLRVLGS